MESTPNELLVVRAQLGDRRALAELVARWREPVRRYVGRMVVDHHAADDLGQQVWVRALRALPRLNQPERFAPWLFTIARRCVLDWLPTRYGDETATAPEVAVDDHSAAVLDRAQVAEGLAGLPVRDREVLILFHLHDFSLAECAEVLQIPAGTVKSRLFKARQALRDQMIERGYRA